MAETFDFHSKEYETWALRLAYSCKSIAERYDFSGTLLELACGTGAFGRELHEHQMKNGAGKLSTIVGNDISPGMVRNNPRPEVYKEVIIGPLQEVIMDTNEHFDHIACMSAFCFLDEVTLSAVLVRMFQVARSSVTFTVEEIPESYNPAMKQTYNVVSNNHLQVVEGFGVPRGWRLAYRKRDDGWKSPTTGIQVAVTIFRFEALQPVTLPVT